ncbi:MAG: hypothetical protein ACI9YH_003620 [Colwellia sp.]|jgi:hypothetical protein
MDLFMKIIRQGKKTTYIVSCILIFFSSFHAVGKGMDISALNTNLAEQGVGLEFAGAFRVNLKAEGDSRSAYAQGTFALSEDSRTFYMVGHVRHQAIAQYAIPKIVKSQNIKDLKITNSAIQPYTKVLHRAQTGNKQNLNRITGLKMIEGELFLNAVEYYDANTNATNTTAVIRDPNNLSKSKVDGFFELNGAAHSAGWISKLPKEWKKKLDATYLTGFANNYPIVTRSSIGPSAFVYYLDNIAQTDLKKGLIPSTPILDYSMDFPLHKRDKNNLWTDVSQAMYGFVIPDTDFYLVIGQSGGHESGIGYKITQNTGRLCGGPCPHDQYDVYHYYWIWDMNDLLKVKQNKLKPHHPKPIHYGEITLPFQPTRGIYEIAGANFDEKQNKLYMLISSADRLQSKYEGAPVMAVFDLINLTKQ